MLRDACTHCGKPELGVVEKRFEFDHNGARLGFIEQVTVCASCTNESYIGSQASAHELAIADAIRKAEGLLSATDLLSIRLKYGFKQTDMEALLSTGPKTWTRWERGKIPQSKAADKLIRLIASDPEIAKQLMDQAGIVNAEASLRFEQFEESTKALTRVAVREELQKIDRGGNTDHYADRVADRALEAVRSSRHQAAHWGAAA